jgi:Rad3-related DNA helicase
MCTRHEIEALGGPNIVASEQVFDKRRVELWTFAKLAHHLQLHSRQASDSDQETLWKGYLKNTFVIVDEAHSILEASLWTK